MPKPDARPALNNALPSPAEQGVLLARLDAILTAHPLLSPLLDQLAVLAPDCWLAAGAVRAAVWDYLHGYPPSLPVEIDLVHYTQECDEAALAARLQPALRARFAEVAEWDIVNQATIHHWLAQTQGQRWPAFDSLAAALASWPETATAIAVRRRGGILELIAPFGLADLFAGVVRHNPARVPAAVFEARLESKGWLRRWPDLICRKGT